MIMNDDSQPRGTSDFGSALMSFVLGAMVGAGLALLLAPESGRKTRERLASTTRRWNERAGRTIDQARDTVAELGTDAKSALKAGQEAFLHDRATREARSARRTTHAGDRAPGLGADEPSSGEASR
jgi:gas vesicle protein